MACLREFIPAIRALGPAAFARKVWREISEDDLFTLAAAMAYSWLFAVFPFLIFLFTLAPYLPEKQKVDTQRYVADFVQTTMPRAGADTLLQSLKDVLNQPKTGLLSVGLAITLWAASGGVAMTMTGLDTAFDAPHVRPFYQQRPLAILLTVLLTVMVLMVFVLLPVGTVVTRLLMHQYHIPISLLWIVNLLRYGLALLLMFGVLATLYTFGTVVKQKFVFFSPGAVFTVLVWIALGETFRFYIDKFGHYEKTYGTIGGVAIILLFFYLDALVLLVGAEINSEVDAAISLPHDLTSPLGPSITSEPSHKPGR